MRPLRSSTLVYTRDPFLSGTWSRHTPRSTHLGHCHHQYYIQRPKAWTRHGGVLSPRCMNGPYKGTAWNRTCVLQGTLPGPTWPRQGAQVATTQEYTRICTVADVPTASIVQAGHGWIILPVWHSNRGRSKDNRSYTRRGGRQDPGHNGVRNGIPEWRVSYDFDIFDFTRNQSI